MGRTPSERPARLAEKLTQIRKSLNLSQGEMVRRMGLEQKLTREDISKYERGLRVPPLLTLLKYARAAKGVLCRLFMGRFPDNFWPMLFGVFFGPLLIAALLRTLYIKTVVFLFSTFGRCTVPVLCLGVVAVSGFAFLYVRSQVLRLTGTYRDTNSLEERRPVLTLLRGRNESICEEEESESYSDYSEED